jgi:hypothetical protein
VPQHLDLPINQEETQDKLKIMFRSTDVYRDVQIVVYSETQRIKAQKKKIIRPGEMQVVELNQSQINMIKGNITVTIELPEEDVE